MKTEHLKSLKTALPGTMVTAALLSSCGGTQAEEKKGTPENPLNVIYILADDMGYGDLSCTGQQRFSTPNIDRLAAQGITFTQHYAGCPVSAPSRSCLMTGLNVGHTPIRGNKEIDPEGQHPLPAGTYTLGRMFRDAGYVTGAFGKWGLGYPGSEGAPEKMGIDRFFGYNCQRQSHRYYPEHLWSDTVKYVIPENAAGACGRYAPDIIQKEALDFIRENSGRPFFTYLAYTLPHAELISPEDTLLARYAGQYEERPYKGIDYAEVTEPAGYCSNDEPYAAFASMMARLDAYVGQVTALVDSLGLTENTLIIFTSDNGPHREGGANPDYFLSYGPFRGVKRDLYEGGIRLPMIARLPGTIAEGTTSDHIATMYDMMPTFAEITGTELPITSDGLSVWPAMTGREDEQKTHETLYWEFHENGGTLAVREGDWKVIAFGLNGRYEHLGETGFPGLRYELYNIAEDIHEDHNLADRYPEKVQHLLEIARRTHVPNENFLF